MTDYNETIIKHVFKPKMTEIIKNILKPKMTNCNETIINNTLEIPSNEKLGHQIVLCNEREREPLHTQLVIMRVT